MRRPWIAMVAAALACLPVLAEAADEAPAVFKYDPHGRRDPFVPLVRDGRFVGVEVSTFSGGGAASLFLGGILWDPRGDSLALLNGEEVRVGDMVGGYAVTEIRRDAVILMRDGKPLVLQLSDEAAPPQTKDKKPEKGGG